MQAFQQQQLQLTEALERLKENETLIRSLQDQLGAISNRTREERGELDSQLRQLQLSLMTRNEECEGFVNELRSVIKLKSIFLILKLGLKCYFVFLF